MPFENHSGDPSEVSTSSSLLERVKRHEPQAWLRLTQLYAPVVYGWSRRYGLTDIDAEDVVQDVFHVVSQRIHAFRRDRPGDSFRGWLWTITRHKLHDLHRQRQSEPQGRGGTDAQLAMAELPQGEPAPVSEASGRMLNPELGRALQMVQAEFEPRTWQAFWRTVVDGVPTADVSRELEMSQGAIRKARFRVLHRLREEFNGLFE